MRRVAGWTMAVGLSASLLIAPGAATSVRAADTATLTMTTSGFAAQALFLFDPHVDYPETALCYDCSSLSITVPLGTRMSAQVISAFNYSLSCSGASGPSQFGSDPSWYGWCGWTEEVHLAGDTTWSATFIGPDTTSPILWNVPPDIQTYATRSDGTIVTWWPDPSASDVDDAASAPVCDANSADVFPVGTTLVTCSSSDTHGNTTTSHFNVTVTWPTYGATIDLTRQLVTRSGVAGQLVSYLEAAQRAETRGNLKAEASNLESYRTLLRAQGGKSVTSDDAALLIGMSTLL